jgi:TonB family protein
MRTPFIILIAVVALLLGLIYGYFLRGLINDEKDETKSQTEDIQSDNQKLLELEKDKENLTNTIIETSEASSGIKGRISTSGPSSIKGSGSGGTNRKSSDIFKVINRITGNAQCKYETRLRSNPNLKGTITIRFTIEMDGSVSSSSIASNTTGDPSFGMEIMSLIRRLNFSSTDRGNVVVVVPFTFSKDQ